MRAAGALSPAPAPVGTPVGNEGSATVVLADGLADVAPSQAQPPNSTAVPFYGYGGINLRFDPSMVMPSGIMLPMSTTVVAGTYREGKPW